MSPRFVTENLTAFDEHTCLVKNRHHFRKVEEFPRDFRGFHPRRGLAWPVIRIAVGWNLFVHGWGKV